MSQQTVTALAALAAGLVIAAICAWRIRSGGSYTPHPVTRTKRDDDPFSFWLSLLIPGVVSIALIVCGVVYLLGA